MYFATTILHLWFLYDIAIAPHGSDSSATPLAFH